MPLHNKHLHPRCLLLSNAKIPKIQFFSSLGTSKMANNDPKREVMVADKWAKIEEK